jgi:hypothetical protein
VPRQRRSRILPRLLANLRSQQFRWNSNSKIRFDYDFYVSYMWN